MPETLYWTLSTIPQVFAAFIAVLFVLFNIRSQSIRAKIQTHGYKAVNAYKVWYPGVVDNRGRANHAVHVENLSTMLEVSNYEDLIVALEERVEYFRKNKPELGETCALAVKNVKKLSGITDNSRKAFFAILAAVVAVVLVSIILLSLVPSIPIHLHAIVLQVFTYSTALILGSIIWYSYKALNYTN